MKKLSLSVDKLLGVFKNNEKGSILWLVEQFFVGLFRLIVELGNGLQAFVEKSQSKK